MAEKRKPTHKLEAFKSACKAKPLNATVTARHSAYRLGFDELGMVDLIQTMEGLHFYKSMTSYGDHKLWQDVYHVPSHVGTLYVKFISHAVTEFILLSFKEKENG